MLKEFKLEKYLLFENQKYRQAVCNFRVNNTRIPQVTGRYKVLDRKQRLCNLCDDNHFRDEYHHVLSECKNVSVMNYKERYLPKYFVNRPPWCCLRVLVDLFGWPAE